ncbi:YetF domain-containing protein [Scopulibacillus cellulosilyticus]|uniref:YetF domain-containing protein n=1 Tax=Scopulibacillus cellulosilyticus TaxID=2665665 RepID=A0ABW2PY67_9BACL
MATVILRTIFLYIVILVTFRMMGKREIGQLSIVDFVVSIMIAELAVISIEDPNKPLFVMIVPILLLLLIQMLLSALSLKSKALRELFDGKPATIIKEGKIDEHEMRKQRYNFDDLLTQLREQNIKNITDVEFGVLEPNGKLSVLKKSDYENNDEKISAMSFPLILDGKVQKQNLEKINQTPLWLRQQLRNLGFRDVKQISYCVLDDDGTFYIDIKDER